MTIRSAGSRSTSRHLLSPFYKPQKTIHVTATEIAVRQNSGFGPHVFHDPDTISHLASTITEMTAWPGGKPLHLPTTSITIPWIGKPTHLLTTSIVVQRKLRTWSLHLILIRSPPCFHDHRNGRLAWREPLHLPTTQIAFPCSSKPLQFLTTSIAVQRNSGPGPCTRP
jgi:hypothetical protein